MARDNRNFVLVTAGTSCSASGVRRGTVDLRSADVGIVTFKITNGGTGPTAQCEARIMIAHTTGATPTTASAGTDWKTIYRIGGGTASNAVTEGSYEFGAGLQHLQVEFTGNTVQDVVVEAYGSFTKYT